MVNLLTIQLPLYEHSKTQWKEDGWGAVETDRELYLVYRYPGLINHMGVNGFTPVAFYPHVCIKYNPW